MLMPVPVVTGSVEDAREHASVGQGRPDRLPNVRLNLLIRHAREIAERSPEVAPRAGFSLWPASDARYFFESLFKNVRRVS
jgi:hypothetical protein